MCVSFFSLPLARPERRFHFEILTATEREGRREKKEGEGRGGRGGENCGSRTIRRKEGRKKEKEREREKEVEWDVATAVEGEGRGQWNIDVRTKYVVRGPNLDRQLRTYADFRASFESELLNKPFLLILETAIWPKARKL